VGQPRRHEDRPPGRDRDRQLSREMRLIVPAPARCAQLAPDGLQSHDRARLHPGHAADVPVLAVGGLQEDRQTSPAATCSGIPASMEHCARCDRRPDAAVRRRAAPDRGYLKAWDPVRRKVVWEIEHPAFWNGGLLTTAGNLPLPGHGRRPLRRVRATAAGSSGRCRLQSVSSPAVTYAVDGEQYWR